MNRILSLKANSKQALVNAVPDAFREIKTIETTSELDKRNEIGDWYAIGERASRYTTFCVHHCGDSFYMILVCLLDRFCFLRRSFYSAMLSKL